MLAEIASIRRGYRSASGPENGSMKIPDPSPSAHTSATDVADPVRSSRYQPRVTMCRPVPAVESTSPTK